MIEKRINYGGGECGPGTGPCQGPDCPNTGGECEPYCDPTTCADGSMPVYSLLYGRYECPDPGPCVEPCPSNGCTGDCCINNECVCGDCSWGEDGDWHVYFSCKDESEIIVLKSNSSAATLDMFNSQNDHFDQSQVELGKDINIGDSFSGITDMLVPGVVYPNDCYTYLGKKYGETPNSTIPDGLTVAEILWAGNVAKGRSYDLSVGECTDCGDPDPEEETSGCMDPVACNYNPQATGTSTECCYNTGCTDPGAINYDISACCDDGSCCFEEGCTDPTACNHNAGACSDDGSCCYTKGCMDPVASNYNANACCDDTCLYEDVPTAEDNVYGIWCIHQPAYLEYPDVTETYYAKLNGFINDTNAQNLQVIASGAWSCTNVMSMLTTPQPINELPELNNSNTPREVVAGDTIEAAGYMGCKTFVGTVITTSDLEINGATNGLDLGGVNLVPFLNSGPCPGTNNSITYKITDSSFTAPCGGGESGYCCDTINDPNCSENRGCMDQTAMNYNSSATLPCCRSCDGSDDNACCAYCVTETEWVNWKGDNPFQSMGATSFATVSNIINNLKYKLCGCTDAAATNYWSQAQVDDGSCVYTAAVSGCTNSLAINYNSSATIDDGSCQYCSFEGPTDQTGCVTNGVCAIGYDGGGDSHISGADPYYISIKVKPLNGGNGSSNDIIGAIKLTSATTGGGSHSFVKQTTGWPQNYNAAADWQRWMVTLPTSNSFVITNNTIQVEVFQSDGAGGTNGCSFTYDITVT